MAANTTTSSPYIQPALIGGLLTGVLSALPLVSAGNICCCLWVVSGGAVAAYLFQQNSSAPISPADGAIVGLLAGLAGAVVHTALSIPIDVIAGPMDHAMVQRILDMGTLSPDMRDMLERATRGSAFGSAFFVISQIFSLMFWAFVGAIFATLGGLLGALVFKKQTPPGVIDIPPPLG